MSVIPLEVKGLAKSFGANLVLQDVELRVEPGMIVGLVGTNGSGKSTLIKCLLGLLRPSAGNVSVLGDTSGDLSASTKSRIAYVAQDVRLFPWMRVEQLLAYVSAFYHTWDTEWVAQLVIRWSINLSDKVGVLSPGQLQKLAIVLAIGHRPELLLLDEPVASLDPVGRREFLRSIMELTAEYGPTILFSTHITSDLERIASHIAVLQHGKIRCFEDLDTLKEQFKRLRIRSNRQLPDSFQVPGALRTEVDGSTALISMPNVSAATIEQLRGDWQAEVDVEDLNLEEIFMELHQ
ncbi:MAG: ABC transporter ATP-binding protein [Planctomycetales bacterium]|nr:ABC transporter ATP-binding protein [Planctomycetales bacterium]